MLHSLVSSLHQRTMHYFMEDGHWHSHLRKMRSVYKRKMKVLVYAIQMHFEENVSLIGTAVGLYIVLEVDTDKSEDWLIQEALKKGIKVYPCSPYFVSSTPKKPHIQLGFAGLTEKEIVEGIQMLADVWKKQTKYK